MCEQVCWSVHAWWFWWSRWVRLAPASPCFKTEFRKQRKAYLCSYSWNPLDKFGPLYKTNSASSIKYGFQLSMDWWNKSIFSGCIFHMFQTNSVIWWQLILLFYSEDDFWPCEGKRMLVLTILDCFEIHLHFVLSFSVLISIIIFRN